MVSVLTRMKWAVVRNSLTGRQAAVTGTGILFGLLQLAVTFWLGLRTQDPSIAADLLLLMFAFSLLGWLFGPLLFGGGKQTLRPEYFRALPIGHLQLAWGLLGAMFVGFAPPFALLQFAVLLPYAARSGTAPLLVATAATVLLTVLVVLLSRVALAVWGELARSRVVIVVGSLVIATIVAGLAQPWALVPAVTTAVSQGLPEHVSGLLRVLPSGWGLVAVDAAARGDWLPALGALGGLVVLIGLLLAAWVALLARQMDGRSSRPLRSSTSSPRLLPRPTTPVGAVVDRELRTWWRDLTRIGFASFALFYALVFCGLPLLADVSVFVPLTGVIGVVVMAGMTANVYAADGTALWLTLTSAGAERSDVRGRQLAWLALVGPAATLLTIGCTLAGGQTWAWPWVLALLPALLGGAAGVVLVLSILAPVPMTDPHLRGAAAMDNGTDYFQFLLTALLTALCALPAFAVVLGGELLDLEWLRWAGVPAGIASGVLWAWLLGRVAYRRLERRGSELMQLMRSGGSLRQQIGTRTQARHAVRLPSPRTLAVYALWTLCPILLFPQGIVPAVFKLIGIDARAWFLALYLAEPWQWPVIVVMIALGLGCGWLALHLSRNDSDAKAQGS